MCSQCHKTQKPEADAEEKEQPSLVLTFRMQTMQTSFNIHYLLCSLAWWCKDGFIGIGEFLTENQNIWVLLLLLVISLLIVVFKIFWVLSMFCLGCFVVFWCWVSWEGVEWGEVSFVLVSTVWKGDWKLPFLLREVSLLHFLINSVVFK